VCAPLTGPNKYFTADYAGMANVIYDITPDRRIDPFVGVGFGATHIQMHTTYYFSGTPGSTVSTPQSLELAGTLTHAGELALQGLAGLSYRIAPKVHLDLTYRYYFTPGDVIWNPLNLTTGVPAASLLRPGNFSGRFADQSAMMGVRYAF
jgi:opacity protein-like surface antigen